MEGNKQMGCEKKKKDESPNERYYPSRVESPGSGFCVLVVAFFSHVPRSSGSTRIENPLSLFLLRRRCIFTPILRELFNAAKTGATFTSHSATLAKLNAIVEMIHNWRLTLELIDHCRD